MVWFQRLFRGPKSGLVREQPIAIDLLPGRLTARVFTHDVPDGPRAVPCWTYVTDGFYRIGQKEFIFTLKRDAVDDPAKPPTDPFRFFSDIFSFAEQRRLLDVGDTTYFVAGEGGFLGLGGMIGITYVAPAALPGVETPREDRCLMAMLLVAGEAAFANRVGAYRVLARLGQAASYYPHPPWSDPGRAPVFTADDLRDSVLTRVPLVRLGQWASLRLRIPAITTPRIVGERTTTDAVGGRLTLRIERDRLQLLRESLDSLCSDLEGTLAIAVDADTEADMRLVWRRVDTEPDCIVMADAEANCMTGGFLLIVYGPNLEENGCLAEDGFAVTLNTESWSRLRQALTIGEPISLPAVGPGQIGLSVEWLSAKRRSDSDKSPALASIPTAGTFLVPDGCSLEVYARTPPLPAVTRIRGGGLIASMGVSSDQPEEDIEGLLDALDRALPERNPDIILSDVARLVFTPRTGPIILSDVTQLRDAFLLFAPARTVPGLVVWVLNPHVFTTWSNGAILLQRLVARWVKDTRERGILPILYVQDPEAPAGALLVSILGDLGFVTRVADREADDAIVDAVQRRDGVIVTCLAGKAFPTSGGAAAWHADLWQQRYLVEQNGDEVACARLDREHRQYLEEKLGALLQTSTRAVEFGRRLRELLGQASGGGDVEFQALLDYLVHREAHLLFLTDPSTGSTMVKEWPGLGRGLEVFPDLSSAREQILGSDPDTTAPLGGLSPRDVLKWMAREGSGVGIRLGDPKEPSRVIFIDAERVRTLAGGAPAIGPST